MLLRREYCTWVCASLFINIHPLASENDSVARACSYQHSLPAEVCVLSLCLGAAFSFSSPPPMILSVPAAVGEVRVRVRGVSGPLGDHAYS